MIFHLILNINGLLQQLQIQYVYGILVMIKKIISSKLQMIVMKKNSNLVQFNGILQEKYYIVDVLMERLEYTKFKLEIQIDDE